MGVEVSLFQVTLFELKRIRRDPDLIDKWFFPEDGGKSDYGENLSLSLGRGFDGLHYVLTRILEPKAGRPIGDYVVFGKHKFRFIADSCDDFTYLLPREVHEINNILRNIKKSTLQINFDHQEMNKTDIYPRRWNPNDFGSIYDLFLLLRKFYGDCSSRGNAIISILH